MHPFAPADNAMARRMTFMPHGGNSHESPEAHGYDKDPEQGSCPCSPFPQDDMHLIYVEGAEAFLLLLLNNRLPVTFINRPVASHH